MRSRKKKAELRSLSADLKRMSETLDYFVPEQAKDEATPVSAPELEPADVRDLLNRAGAAQATAPQPASEVSQPAAEQREIDPLQALESPAVVEKRSRATPIEASLPPVVPPEGLPWSPELVEALLPHLTPRQFMVYQAVYMASYARGLPCCRLRRRDIRRATGLSEATVRRALADLTGPLALLEVRELPRFVYEIRPLIPAQVLEQWQGRSESPPS